MMKQVVADKEEEQPEGKKRQPGRTIIDRTFRPPTQRPRPVDHPAKEIFRALKNEAAPEDTSSLPTSTSVPQSEQLSASVETQVEPSVTVVTDRDIEPIPTVATVSQPAELAESQRPTRRQTLEERFAALEKRYSLVLSESHLKALRVIFENTVAIGKREFNIPGPHLAEIAGVKRRQISNVLQKLQGLGLIEREQWKEQNQDKGLTLRFTTDLH